MIRHIQDRDLWRFKLPNTKEISIALRSYPQDFKVWDELMYQTHRLAKEGVAINRWFDQTLQGLKKHARRLRIGGYEVPVVNSKPNCSRKILAGQCRILVDEGSGYSS